MNIKLTVFFEEPFWVGVFERVHDGMLETSKVTFGSEPKDIEVYSCVLENYFKLDFSRPVRFEAGTDKRINPKRLQRMIKRETIDSGIGTKAQQAMKLEIEARKIEHKQLSREKREELEQLNFEKRQEKKKEKKKGH
jgi:hypothetical protein